MAERLIKVKAVVPGRRGMIINLPGKREQKKENCNNRYYALPEIFFTETTNFGS